MRGPNLVEISLFQMFSVDRWLLWSGTCVFPQTRNSQFETIFVCWQVNTLCVHVVIVFIYLRPWVQFAKQILGNTQIHSNHWKKNLVTIFSYFGPFHAGFSCPSVQDAWVNEQYGKQLFGILPTDHSAPNFCEDEPKWIWTFWKLKIYSPFQASPVLTNPWFGHLSRVFCMPLVRSRGHPTWKPAFESDARRALCVTMGVLQHFVTWFWYVLMLHPG